MKLRACLLSLALGLSLGLGSANAAPKPRVLEPQRKRGYRALTAETFRAKAKQGQKVSIAWVRFAGIKANGVLLVEGGQRNGRPLRSPLSGALWAPDRLLKDRLRKNRDSGRLSLVRGGPVQVFGKVTVKGKRKFLRLLEVRKLRSLVSHFEAQAKAIKSKLASARLTLVARIEQATAAFPAEREALKPTLRSLREEAKELSLVVLAKTPLPKGAEAWIKTGLATRQVEFLAKVCEHPEVGPKLRERAETILRTQLRARTYLGRWYSETGYREALGFAPSPPALMRAQGWAKVRWVPEPLAFLAKQAEAVKRKGLVFDVSRGLRAQALAQGQVVKSMSKKEVVAACVRSLGAGGSFPVRVERYRETYKNKKRETKERTWELWVMKNGLRVVFVGGVVATKIEP